MFKQIFAILAVSVITAGCGKTTEDLNDLQISTLKEFTSSASSLNSSTEANGVSTGGHAPNLAGGRSISNPGLTFFSQSNDLTLNEKTLKMTDILKLAVKEGRCKVISIHTALGSLTEFSGPSNAFNFTDPKKDCPVYAKIAFKVITATDSTFDINFQALSQEFKEFSDIDLVDLSFKFNIATPIKNSYSSRMEGSGTIRSQKIGSVGVSFKNTSETNLLTGNLDEKIRATGNADLSMEFKNFAVELAADYTGGANSMTAKYKLNGKDMTDEEINEYFSGMTPVKSSLSNK
ncbi:MAG: hypothetical protein KA715_00800 [Xanthomonadaceae bacterium]|nr:hypothetical protein [Xanthomonadaceae bacterium]